MSIVLSGCNKTLGWGALVSDSGIFGGTGAGFRDSKITRLSDGSIISCVGEFDAAAKLTALVDKYKSFDKIPVNEWPKTEDENNIGCLLITPSLDMYRCDGQNIYLYIEDFVDTVGQASEFALGYMLSCFSHVRRNPEDITLRQFLSIARKTIAAMSEWRPHSIAMPEQIEVIKI